METLSVHFQLRWAGGSWKIQASDTHPLQEVVLLIKKKKTTEKKPSAWSLGDNIRKVKGQLQLLNTASYAKGSKKGFCKQCQQQKEVQAKYRSRDEWDRQPTDRQFGKDCFQNSACNSTVWERTGS